jgi:uncharacterized protein YggE
MKKIITCFLIAATLVFGKSSELPNFPFIFIDEKAEKEYEPNIANIELSIGSASENASFAFDTVNTASKSVLSILGSFGISDSDIVAYSIQKSNDSWSRYRYDEKEPPKYQISRNVSLTLKDLSKYSSLIDTLAVLSNVDINSTSFDISNEVEVNDSLYNEVCRKAKKSAMKLAESMGSKLGEIHAISEYSFGDMSDYFGMRENPMYHARGSQTQALSRATTFMVPKSITKSKVIFAIFKLKAK